jgi:hypothetical protein
MKTLKNIFLLLIVLISISGCTAGSYQTEVANPKEFTSVVIKEMPTDTIVVIKTDKNLFVINDEGLVIEAYLIDPEIPIQMLCIFFLGCVLIMFLSEMV